MNTKETPMKPQSDGPISSEHERDAFERWARANQFCTHRDDSDKYREYHRATTRWAWQAWQAARVDLVAALQWYADGLHFDKASPDAWDTVSGEPQNWWCDEAGTATVEDGSIAMMTLRGELTAAQIQALD